MNYVELVKEYNKAGFACLPTKEDKSPLFKESWLNGFPPEKFTDCYGVGIICGSISNGLECGDWDNHFGDAKENLSKFIMIPEVREIYEKYKLPIEATVSGGFHLLWRCDKIENNKKLAERYLNGRPDAIIETRGGNGYFVCAPSPGYKVIKNDLCHVEKITIQEREIIIDNAKSFNEVEKKKHTVVLDDQRPGDKYDRTSEAIEDMKSSLRSAGWKDNGDKWTRPGKSSGVSATVGKVAPNVFYPFSSNCSPFEPNHGYTPFQVISLLDYNGDFAEFAKVLSEKYGEKPSYKSEEKQKSNINYDDILNKTFVDLSIPIEKPPVCMQIKDRENNTTYNRRLFTLGNFSAITGKGKSKKTFLSSLFLATACTNHVIQDKIIGSFPEGKNAVLLFDTEQGLYDVYVVGKRVYELIGQEYEGFGVFALREYSPSERIDIIEHALEKFKDNIGYVVIDGIADLTTAINDEEKASFAVGLLMKWTKKYNCHITTIIHQNKNDDFATGHLGSSIIKKAEAVIKVRKSNESSRRSHVECDAIRGVSDFNDFDFEINENGIPIIDNDKTYTTAF